MLYSKVFRDGYNNSNFTSSFETHPSSSEWVYNSMLICHVECVYQTHNVDIIFERIVFRAAVPLICTL